MLPLYTNEDPAYKNTKRASRIPPPTLATFPKMTMYTIKKGNGNNETVMVTTEEYRMWFNANGSNNNQHNNGHYNNSAYGNNPYNNNPYGNSSGNNALHHNQLQYQRSNHQQPYRVQYQAQAPMELRAADFQQQQQRYGNSAAQLTAAVTRRETPAADTTNDLVFVINNTYGRDFLHKNLPTTEWSRMMGENNSPRGRMSNSKLVDISQLQAVHAYKNLIAKGPVDVKQPHIASALKDIVAKHPVDVSSFNYVAQKLNPYAGLCYSVFTSVAAVALAQVDFLFGAVRRYLTKPKFRFVDLGSSKGGYAEYILWRAARNQDMDNTRGWYFGSSDVSTQMLSECRAPELLDIYDQSSRGILDLATINSFVKHVRLKLGQEEDGVDLIVAEADNLEPWDLGVGHEKKQHFYSIAQAITALRLLRPGGTFVLKVHEMSIPLSAEIMFLLHVCFERSFVFRPLTSSPTSAERYIVFSNLIEASTWVAMHLESALVNMQAANFRLCHLVSWTNVSNEEKFVAPLFQMNNKLAKTQLMALKAIDTYIADQENLDGLPAVYKLSKQQEDVANSCFKKWGLPLSNP
ncbi:hypothetical protein LPJ57_003211 [Coemansia sp. RSA 486]|nr:hypothetical protein LPJ57_003211 [Coemansia sp. RSA 486]